MSKARFVPHGRLIRQPFQSKLEQLLTAEISLPAEMSLGRQQAL